MGSGRIVAESTSPVGNGTAGLLLMKGILPLLLSKVGTAGIGEFALGDGPGETEAEGWKGHGNDGEDDTIPPATGSGAVSGAAIVEWAAAPGSGDTKNVNFLETSHASWVLI